VVDAYLNLAEMPAGQRPVQSVVGIAWGVDEMNRLLHFIQDKVLTELQLEGVLGGVSARPAPDYRPDTALSATYSACGRCSPRWNENMQFHL
jgi:hypothetical protein